MPKIQNIECHKQLNSRGDWTVETTVLLDNGVFGTQVVPEGASKGENEAIYVEADRAVAIVESAINDALIGKDPTKQKEIDDLLIKMDGTSNKKILGGNSILSVSLAVARAAAKSLDKELYEYLSFLYSGKYIKESEIIFPTPCFNILNGGKHATNGLSFQEFMIIPNPSMDFEKKIDIGVKVYKTLKKNLLAQGFEAGVGDEGGFAPENFTTSLALEFIGKSISESYKFGEDAFIGMDVAAESFYFDGEYNIKEENLKLNYDSLKDYYIKILDKYPVVFLEDPFYEQDIDSWKKFKQEIKNRDGLMLVADDLVVTNPDFLKGAIENDLANAVIVKPNQVGSLTETLEFIKMAQENKMKIIISHRSGDTAEDSFIADLALAVKAEYLKSGSPVRGERVVKYNRLLDIYYKFKKS